MVGNMPLFVFIGLVTALTITLLASHGMAAVKTASNIDRGNTIAHGTPPTAERP